MMIRYIWGITSGFRGRITISATAGIARVITGLIFVALSKRAVDLATGDATGNLVLCVAGLVCALMVELICAAIGNRTTELSEADMKNSIQKRLFTHLMSTKWNGNEKYHSGEVLSRLTEDCRVAAECLCQTVPTAMIATVQLVGAYFFLWYFSPLLAITLIVILPLFFFAGKVFFRKMKVLTRRIRDIESRLQEKMQESLQHRILLLTCRQTLRTIDAISALHHSRYSIIRRRTNITMYSRTAVIAGFESGYLAAFLWGIHGLYNGTISFGMMTAYLQLAGQIQRPLAELARLLPGLIQSHTAFSRISEIERMPVEEESSESEMPGNLTPLGISFHDVSFSYPGKETPVMSKFNHIFAPGSKTAIMGETGAGKSTLLRMILALLTPQEGEIDIFSGSGEDVTAMPVSSATRGQIVYVPQGNSLLSGTIRYNLRTAKPDATEEEMRAALHDAAADFVFDLKFGLETTCGEHGDGLSEGQAQRIAIARGLLRPGAILLLDEISAALDEETEKQLMQRLSQRTGLNTILFVTHRPGVIPFCDDILRI
ncbi:MAG: ABC transporter ATP-binding protein/permease [Muribaculaceae bacterium]|nr:ABC transporter ATP-binding protein/permease [Muribaculaceae bacterium]